MRPTETWLVPAPPYDHRAPISALLQKLLLHAPEPKVTLGWLMESLGDRSFGIVLLLLGLLGSLPGASIIAGVAIAFPAFEMMLGHAGPVFPRFIAERAFETRRLAAVLNRAIPVLRYLEHIIRPRWHTGFAATKRVVGVAILLVGILLFAPIPLSNIPPGLAIMLLAFAYLEEDGILLCVALAVTLRRLRYAEHVTFVMKGGAIVRQ